MIIELSRIKDHVQITSQTAKISGIKGRAGTEVKRLFPHPPIKPDRGQELGGLAVSPDCTGTRIKY